MVKITQKSQANKMIGNFNQNDFVKLNYSNISQIFDKQAKNNPLNIALECLHQKNTYKELKNKIEKDLILLWQNILEQKSIALDETFYELGGNSLQAIELIKKINNHFNLNLSVSKLYSNPTIKKFVELIDEHKSL